MQIEFGMSMTGLDDVAGNAQRLEALGYDYVGCGEHVSFHGPTSNSFISLSVAAGATRTIKLISAIVLPATSSKPVIDIPNSICMVNSLFRLLMASPRRRGQSTQVDRILIEWRAEESRFLPVIHQLVRCLAHYLRILMLIWGLSLTVPRATVATEIGRCRFRLRPQLAKVARPTF